MFFENQGHNEFW